MDSTIKASNCGLYKGNNMCVLKGILHFRSVFSNFVFYTIRWFLLVMMMMLQLEKQMGGSTLGMVARA